MNQFGRIFRLNIFGESHGKGIGIVMDGCPVGIALCETDFEVDLNRRRAGAKGTTPRKEKDIPVLLSGIFQGFTTGAPLTIWFENADVRSKDYSDFLAMPRPGHADFVSKEKYHGYADYRGGGHFSGRLTLALVAAGVVAKKIVSEVTIKAELTEAGGSKNVDAAVAEAMSRRDSIGGVVSCHAHGLPVGWGEPFFDSVESMIAHLAFSIPAIKGIEFGSGFAASQMSGSEHNDAFVDKNGCTKTNHSGGINGGITNGNELHFRLAVKPTASIGTAQQTYNFNDQKLDELKVEGRHDACIALRVPVVVEAITAIALADFKLIQKTQL